MRCGEVFGVFALAFCREELREGKAKAKAPSREESGGLWEDCGRLVRCGEVFGGFGWAFCRSELREGKSTDKAPSREESGGLWEACAEWGALQGGINVR